MKSSARNPQPDSLLTSGVCKKGPLPPGIDCKDGRCVRYSNGSDILAALELAKEADIVLVFVATNAMEGGDRGLDLGNQDALIESIAKVYGEKTAVIAVAPGPILTPWRDDIAAILTPLLPGQEYGNAIADVLVGAVSPGGKLPVTFPSQNNEMNFTQSQCPGIDDIALYSEGLEVGYRWYAAHQVKPAYPFGHGLSYTTFEYSDLHVDNRKVQCKVQNVGKVRGSEVSQLYLEFPAAAQEPPKQLKGYQKIDLAPGESKLVTFELDDRSFSIWDSGAHAWSIAHGDFGIMVGSSSEYIRLTGTLSGVGYAIV